jgi:hypothetical protein
MRTESNGWKALAAMALLLALPALARAQSTGEPSRGGHRCLGSRTARRHREREERGHGPARSATTSSEGFYTLPLLPPGQYEVKATLAGFNTITRSNVRVTVSETARVNLAMQVGAVTENVTIVGEAPLVETANAHAGHRHRRKEGGGPPPQRRNFAQLGTLIPGVVAPPAAWAGSAATPLPAASGTCTGSFNVNGMRNQSNNFLLDGASNNDTFNTGFVLRPPPDAIQEFKILTHSYSAEYGRNAGSVVNVVTKSGTNRWHERPGSSIATTLSRRGTSSRPPRSPNQSSSRTSSGRRWAGPWPPTSSSRSRITRGTGT